MHRPWRSLFRRLAVSPLKAKQAKGQPEAYWNTASGNHRSAENRSRISAQQRSDELDDSGGRVQTTKRTNDNEDYLHHDTSAMTSYWRSSQLAFLTRSSVIRANPSPAAVLNSE